MPSKKSLMVTLLQAMRASWHFGGATKAHSEEGAFREYGQVLSLLSHPRVDPGMPIARTVLVLSLGGYCDVAKKLGRRADALEQLTKWRPVYVQWISPGGDQVEQDELARLEATFAPRP